MILEQEIGTTSCKLGSRIPKDPVEWTVLGLI